MTRLANATIPEIQGDRIGNALKYAKAWGHIVVLKGAYVYKPEHGAEQRVSAGQYLFIPGGDRHVSGGDAKEGALFYQESTGKFDLNPVQ